MPARLLRDPAGPAGGDGRAVHASGDGCASWCRASGFGAGHDRSPVRSRCGLVCVKATRAASPQVGVVRRAVRAVAADDDRIDAQRPGQGVDALPGVGRRLDERVRIDDDRTAGAGLEPLVVRGSQAGTGRETDPQAAGTAPGRRRARTTRRRAAASGSRRRRPTRRAGRLGARRHRPGMHEDRPVGVLDQLQDRHPADRRRPGRSTPGGGIWRPTKPARSAGRGDRPGPASCRLTVAQASNSGRSSAAPSCQASSRGRASSGGRSSMPSGLDRPRTIRPAASARAAPADRDRAGATWYGGSPARCRVQPSSRGGSRAGAARRSGRRPQVLVDVDGAGHGRQARGPADDRCANERNAPGSGTVGQISRQCSATTQRRWRPAADRRGGGDGSRGPGQRRT